MATLIFTPLRDTSSVALAEEEGERREDKLRSTVIMTYCAASVIILCMRRQILHSTVITESPSLVTSSTKQIIVSGLLVSRFQETAKPRHQKTWWSDVD